MSEGRHCLDYSGESSLEKGYFSLAIPSKHLRETCLMPKPSKPFESSAVVGAMLQRQKATMEGLHQEASAAYATLSKESLLSYNTPDRSAMGSDAFRHAYASARATQEYGTAVASVLGRGVEWMAAATRENEVTNLNARDIGMDLHNNSVGREIAQELGPKATPEQLRDAIATAAANNRLILSTSDPRALQSYEASPDMKGLSAAHDAVSNLRSMVSGGIEKASDLLEEGRNLGNKLEGLKDALKDAIEKATNSPFFKFSEAELQEGEKFASNLSPDKVNELGENLAVADRWEMSQEAYAQLDPNRESAEKGVPSFDSQNAREEQVALQDRLEGVNREQAQEHEMEMSMEA